MEIIRKNLFSIICGVIALLAVGALFWPISNMYTTLGTELDGRIQVSNSLDGLSNTSRQMPQLSPDSTTTDSLDVFPVQPVYDAAQNAVGLISAQAKKMNDYATSINKHSLLIDDPTIQELPKPVETTKFVFANQYYAAVNNYTRWQKILDSTMPPTPAEVQAAKDKLQDDINKQRLLYDTSGNVDPQSKQDADAYFSEEAPLVEPRMELESAKAHRIYLMTPPTVNPGPLPVDSTIKVGSYPSAEQICKAQVVMWVIDDIVNAIAQANELYSDPQTPGGPPQHDVLHSVVKSIESMDLPTPVLASSSGGIDVNAGVTTAAAKVYTASPTGRVCNGRYDVLRFKLHLIVDAAKLPLLIKTLESGQFITVLNVQVNEVVDPVMAASNPLGGFRYGNKPVIRCELDCEELLLRSWTDAIFPDDMKNGFGQGLGTPTDNGDQGGYPSPYGMPGGMPYGAGPMGPNGPYYGPPPHP